MNKKYENMQEGKIIVVKNFKFEDEKIDHAWNLGRLCIVLYSDDEYEYVLPITTYIANTSLRKKYYYINDNSFLFFYKNRYVENTLFKYVGQNTKHNSFRNTHSQSKAQGYINLRNIYKIPVMFRDEIGKLHYKVYNNILNKTKELHQLDTEELKQSALLR